VNCPKYYLGQRAGLSGIRSDDGFETGVTRFDRYFTFLLGKSLSLEKKPGKL